MRKSLVGEILRTADIGVIEEELLDIRIPQEAEERLRGGERTQVGRAAQIERTGNIGVHRDHDATGVIERHGAGIVVLRSCLSSS